jgi:hypothetical protein
MYGFNEVKSTVVGGAAFDNVTDWGITNLGINGLSMVMFDFLVPPVVLP